MIHPFAIVSFWFQVIIELNKLPYHLAIKDSFSTGQWLNEIDRGRKENQVIKKLWDNDEKHKNTKTQIGIPLLRDQFAAIRDNIGHQFYFWT